jgi:succinate dehydrogenase / fumarate reductase cytochrome b subunit
MSSVATRPAAAIQPAKASRLRWIFRSSVGLKIMMALTGILLCLFLLVHMLGNLQVFQGEHDGVYALDRYAALLHAEPAILWFARVVLLSLIGLHIYAYIMLMRKNAATRPVGYRALRYKESSYASRSMAITGPLVAAFVVYHILHFTTGTVHPKFNPETVHQNVVTGFQVLPVALFYIVALAALGLHLWHGVWSMFQTLGATQPRYLSFGRRVATGFTLLVIVGFMLVPISIALGLVK